MSKDRSTGHREVDDATAARKNRAGFPSEDPTERIHALQKQNIELTLSRDHFFDLYEYAPVGYLVLDNDLVIRESNQIASVLLGASCRQLIGTELLDYVSPEHRDALLRIIRQTIRSNSRQSCQVECRRTGATNVYLRIESVPASEGLAGAQVCRAILIDVTENIETELRIQQLHEQLEMAARAAQLGVWNIDPTSGKAKWNHQLYLLLGLEPRECPEDGNRFFEFIHPEDRTGIITNLQAILESSEDHIDEEFRIIGADGKCRWLASRGRIYRDQHGRPLHIAGINLDITERKQAEETIRLAHLKMAAQLSETDRINEELSQYAYAVSHDLKGPLRAIRNYADFLYEDLADTLSGDQKKYLEGMKTAVDQGDALINDLLSFSRIGRVPLEIGAADVPDVVNEIRSILNPSSEVEIAVESTWPDFSVDRTLLKQILHNLISNGIKFNERTPKRIEIGWHSAPEDYIDIVVRDNGIGIAPQYQDQIFRIFQRLHLHRDYDGTGIGLAIVQKAAYKLGGAVRLKSEPGKGSTFTVRLPRAPNKVG